MGSCYCISITCQCFALPEEKLIARLEEQVRELRGELTSQKLASLSDKEVLDVALPLFLGGGAGGTHGDELEFRRMCH